jgi:nucleoside-diphosphate-sugar epimerase
MWGDGNQTRSFTYIDDCVEGILRLTKSDFCEPVNLGGGCTSLPQLTKICATMYAVYITQCVDACVLHTVL